MKCDYSHKVFCNGKDVRPVLQRRIVEGRNLFDGPVLNWCKGCRQLQHGCYKFVKLPAKPEFNERHPDDPGRKHLMECPRCKKRWGRMRSGADFAGEAICSNCWFTWRPEGLPGYAYMP